MSKIKKKLAIPEGQLSLFELVRQEMACSGSPQPGAANIKYQVIAALKEGLSHAGKSREQIADEMTISLGEDVTVHMINAWVAESKENHRFPLEYAGAFSRATNCMKPLDVAARACGAFALRGPDALRADIRKVDEREKSKKEEIEALRSEKKRLEVLLQEVEARR